ncbi:run and sh3 domain containing [Holotrichia oblita]|uniref:Run and sh3 domain containing n=1 Tax=Holotrichia oblita TaxID=644536 RepID=A0ACB9SXW3_HOLOL|nr:run and sh3 domain containing [Holotrichia oblita]
MFQNILYSIFLGMSTALDHSSNSENWPITQSSDSNISDTKSFQDKKKQLKQDLEDSLLEQKLASNIMKSCDVILEDHEQNMSRSESVEQLSESTGKSESMENSSDMCYYGCNYNRNNNNNIDNKKKFKSKSTNTKRNNSLGISLSSDSTNSSYIERKQKFCKHVSVNLMNKSMQTSFPELLKNVPYKLNCNNVKESVKVVEPSFLTKLKEESEVPKPVYILYPSYALPNLDFLKNKDGELTKVLLMPQQHKAKISGKRRPFSCNDFEALKKKGFAHVQDWDSLNVLLPSEYKKVLAGVPEVAQYINKKEQHRRKDRRPLSCEYGALERTNSLDRASSSSSTTTQPSSGYRGSSTMLLTDSQGSPATTNLNPLFVYRYDSVTSSEASFLTSEKQKSITTIAAPPLPKRSISLADQCRPEMVPPRPPLPRGILRKGEKLLLNQCKRYSMVEAITKDEDVETVNKHQSYPEAYFLPRNKRLSETEDEGVDAGTSSSSLDEQQEVYTTLSRNPVFSHLSCEDIVQLEEFLKLSGISLASDGEETDEESLMQLRSCVSRFLALRINQDCSKKSVSFAERVKVLPKMTDPKLTTAPNNSPNVSAMMNNTQRQYSTKTLVDMPICEEGETSPENYSSPHATPTHKVICDLTQKRALVSAVTDAVEQMIHHFSPATDQCELNTLGDSELTPTCAKLALTCLCPSLYAVLSDGLKPTLETSFGAIGNSVWQVVEASAQQGPLTKALNELVMHINAEDAITEGLVKFNAFVFGLLNVRSLDAWASFLRTRESVIKRHYEPGSLLLMSLTGSASIRSLLDTLIASLQPLALLPFQFDILFEYRQLHQSLKRMDSYQHLTSPTHAKHWKSGYSTHSNISDIEEASVPTALHNSTSSPDKTLPDLLNSSENFKPTIGKQRPRSCVEPGYLSKPSFKLGEDVNTVAKKRWSGISLSSKLYQAYSRLAHESEEEYTDSLENNHHQNTQDEITRLDNVSQIAPESLDSNFSDDKPLNGKKFKKLQKKWEMLSGKESISPPESPTHNKSKIPRPVASPVKPSGIPIPISPSTTKSNMKGITIKKVVTPPGGIPKKIPAIVNKPNNLVKTNSIQKKGAISNSLKTRMFFYRRTSRLDQLENGDSPRQHAARPSSLPYKSISQSGKNGKIVPQRRAVSTSVSRKQTTQSQTPKVVRTLSHRLPSESGHLSFNEGEKLKVVLEVDEQWLLCCRGTQKGLVPRSAVIADIGRF